MDTCRQNRCVYRLVLEPPWRLGENRNADWREHQTEDAAGELSAVVDELLDGLSTKFSTVSAEIFAKSECRNSESPPSC